MLSVRERIRVVADSLGFPEELRRPNVASFDQPATRILHNQMGIVPADAASDEVWNFVTLVLLPDVAVWRFPGRADERLLGRPRNVFRRLWWRAETVGADVIDAPRGLGEDELVNIMEKTTIAANPRTASLLAQLIFERGDETGIARSELMRDVTKRFLRQQAVLCMDVLCDATVQEILEVCFRDAVASLRLGPTPSIPPVRASWLPDPSGRHELRWWSGRAWTQHVSDEGVVAADAEPWMTP